jgi:N-acyl amino acid synthase of PEP-CTERM/exosortase system
MNNAYALRHFDQHYVMELATETRQIRDAQAFRYQVFCREHRILAGDAEHSTEGDEYDASARHVILRERKSAEIIGTVRLVLARPQAAPNKFFPAYQPIGPLRVDVPAGEPGGTGGSAG